MQSRKLKGIIRRRKKKPVTSGDVSLGRRMFWKIKKSNVRSNREELRSKTGNQTWGGYVHKLFISPTKTVTP